MRLSVRLEKKRGNRKTFIVLASFDKAVLAKMVKEDLAKLKAQAKKQAQSTGTDVVGIWLTDALDFQLVAVVLAADKDKAVAFLDAFETPHGASTTILDVQVQTSANFADAFGAHTKM